MTAQDLASLRGGPARQGAFRMLLRNPFALVSMVVLAVLVVVAIVQPWITPFPPGHVEIKLTNALPFSSHYLLGGDRFGRDILSELIGGTRNALLSGLILTSVALGVGTLFGLVAGYFGGVLDVLGNGFFALLLAVPGIILLIALYTLIDVSMPIAMATLGLLSSAGVFLLVRSLTRNVRSELYVDAAKVSGLSNIRIVGRHVLLAIRSPIIILAAFLSGGALAVSAGLDFIGLGDASQPSWGTALNDAFSNYYLAPWQLIWPGLILGIGTGAFVLLGNGLRDALEGTYIKVSARRRRRDVAQLLAAAEIEPRSTTPRVRSESDSDTLLVIEDLQVAYETAGAVTTVVDAVSLTVSTGEVVGLVGESGSGKSQTVFSALGLLPEQAIVLHGSIRFEGTELLGAPERVLQVIRGSQIGYVPQEPMSNLDPSFRVGSQLIESIRAQSGVTRAAARELALSMLARVGISDPKRTFRSYPHEISGGMAQRVLIAGAVACRPKLLIADEPTTALDVTVQAEVLDLLRDLQQDFGMGVLIVTHNLGVVADLCDRVVVMKAGAVVESGEVRDVLLHPSNEYTQMLIDSLLDDTEARSMSEAGRAS